MVINHHVDEFLLVKIVVFEHHNYLIGLTCKRNVIKLAMKCIVLVHSEEVDLLLASYIMYLVFTYIASYVLCTVPIIGS